MCETDWRGGPTIPADEYPDVAVVIPFFNDSRSLESAVKSVLAQTVPPAEIIVVNDGSNPHQTEEVNRLSTELNFRLATIRNSGQSAARNFGVSLTSSEFICFLDQDDCFFVDHIETLLGGLESVADTKLGMVYGDVSRCTQGGDLLFNSAIREYGATHPLTSLPEFVRRDMIIVPSATLISREAFLEVGGFDPELRGYEDDDLFTRIFVAGYSLRFVDVPVSMWTVNLGSSSYSRHMAESRWKYCEKLLASTKMLTESNELRKLVIRRFLPELLAEIINTEHLDGAAGYEYNPQVDGLFTQLLVLVSGDEEHHFLRDVVLPALLPVLVSDFLYAAKVRHQQLPGYRHRLETLITHMLGSHVSYRKSQLWLAQRVLTTPRFVLVTVSGITSLSRTKGISRWLVSLLAGANQLA